MLPKIGGGAPRAAEAPMTLGAGRGDRKMCEQREGRNREGAAAAARLTGESLLL